MNVGSKLQWWIVPLALVPAIPKVKAFAVGGTAVLVDDAVMVASLMAGLTMTLGLAARDGAFPIRLTSVGCLLLALLGFKAVNLGILALFYPWADLGSIGFGPLVGEGVLVLGRMAAFLSLYVLVYNYSAAPTALYSALRVLIACMAIVAGYALFQLFVLNHKVVTSTFRNIYLLGIKGRGGWGLDDPWFDPTAVGHEHLGAFMILAFSLSGGVLLQVPMQGWRKVAWFAFWCACGITLIFASSRGAWIGGAFSVMGLAWGLLRQGSVLQFLRALFFLGLTFFVVETWKGLGIVDYIEDRVSGLIGITSGEIKDDSAKFRLGLLKHLWDTFLKYPIVGWGPGGAGRIAEGQFVRELVEGGVVGGLLYFAVMYRTGLIVFHNYRLSPDPLVRGVSIGFLCGLVGLLGQSFFTELFILTKIGVPFWLLAALVHRMSALQRVPLQRRKVHRDKDN